MLFPWRIIGFAGLLALAGEWNWVRAQPLAEGRSSPPGLFHLYSVSTYSGYTSFGLPNANFNYLSGSAPVGPDYQWGGSVRAGLLRSRRRSTLSLIYDGSYDGMARHSEWSGASHKLTFTASRRLGRRWEIRGGMDGSARNLYQFLFEPSSLSSVAAVPKSFDQLASAMLGGRFTNEQLAGILTGAPGLEAAGRTALYGNRVLGARAIASLAYAHSRRFMLKFGAGASHDQNLLPPVRRALATEALLPRTTSATANVGFTYSPTARTDLGLEADATRTVSNLQDFYTTKALASLGRRLGRRWLIKGHAGPAWITPVRQTYTLPVYALPTGVQYAAGGSIAFATPTQTALASLERTPSDAYGAGAQHTISSSAAWSWRRRRSAWSWSASFRQQQMRGIAQRLNGWMVTGAVARGLSGRTAVEVAYTYLNNSGAYLGTIYQMEANAVRVSFIWREQRQPKADAGPRR